MYNISYTRIYATNQLAVPDEYTRHEEVAKKE